jgi:hypothetical protein
MASNFDHVAILDAISAEASERILIESHFAEALMNDGIIKNVEKNKIMVCYSHINYTS